MAAAQYFETVQKLYIAFYQRPADPGGLLSWAQRLEVAKGSLDTILPQFAASPETARVYGPINSSTIGNVVDAIYLALFGRVADAGGKDFYVRGFNTGKFSPAGIALDILNGALNNDAVAIQNKVTVANRFTEAVDGRALSDINFGVGTNFAATYSGSADEVAARAYLTAVTSNPTTIRTAEQVRTDVATRIADAGDAILTSQTFTLTASAPSVTETDGETKVMTFTVTLDKAYTTTKTVNYSVDVSGTAAQGDDFTVTAGSVTFAPGQTTAEIAVTVLADRIDEANETVVLKFSGQGLIGNTLATGTIVDDDHSFIFTSPAAATVAENTTAVLTATGADADTAMANVTASLSGPDAALFTLVSGNLSFRAAPNFEAPADVGRDNVYNVSITATDNDGNATTQDLAITVSDANETPTAVTSAATGSIAENAPISTVAYTATASDVDAGEVFSYSLTGADAAAFDINAATGAVTLKASANFEAKASYAVNVVATDRGGLSASKAVTINVTNVNEAPVGNDDTATVTTGNRVTINALANDTDVDANTTLSIAAASVATAGSGTVAVVNNQLVFTAAPGFQGPATINYTVSDGTLTDTATATVMVGEPLLTAAAASVNEGQNVVFNVKGVANTEYSVQLDYNNLDGRADEIRRVTTDANGDAQLSISTNLDRTTEGAQSVRANIVGTLAAPVTVTVADTSDNNVAPVAVNATAAVAEGATTSGQLTATDVDAEDAGRHTFTTASVVPGFALNANGSWTFDATNAAYNSLAVGQTSVQTVNFTVNDNAVAGNGPLTGNGTLTITVTGTNDNPVVTVGNAATTVNENTTLVTNFATSDVDNGDVLSAVTLSGEDAALFQIVAATGNLEFRTAPDFEDPTDANRDGIYNVTLNVSDNNGGTGSRAVVITVADGPENARLFNLTSGGDAGVAFTGDTGNDTFNALETTNAAGAVVPTWTVGDSIDGAGGADTFNVTQGAAVINPLGATVTGIETMNVTTNNLYAGAATALNTAAFTGLTALNVTSPGTNTITAAGTTAISVTNNNLNQDGTGAPAPGVLTVNGGSTVSVTSVAAVTDTISGAVVVGGAAAAPTGAVTVNTTSNYAVAGATGLAAVGQAVTVTGGTSVTVNNTLATTGNAGGLDVLTGGVVTVNGGASTTTVSVTQTAARAQAGQVGGIANGQVVVTDANAQTAVADTITTVTLNNYGNNSLIGSGALSTLNLSGNVGASTLTVNGQGAAVGQIAAASQTATTIAVNANGLTAGNTTLTGYTVVNLDASTAASNVAGLVAATAANLNISGNAALTLGNQTLTATAAIVSTNTAGVTLTTALGQTQSFAGGTGADSIGINGNATVAYTMGDGDDTVRIAAGTPIGNDGMGVGGSLAGGNGRDTIAMDATDAAAASGNPAFNADVTGFEVLDVTDSTTASPATIDLSGINAVNSVTARATNAGLVANDAIAINNFRSGGTLTLDSPGRDNTGNYVFNIGVDRANGQNIDVFNVVLRNAAQTNFGQVTLTNIETLNVTTVDTGTTAALTDGATVQSLTVDAGAALTTVTVSGNNGLILGSTGANSFTAVTSFDASAVVADSAAAIDTVAGLGVTFNSQNATAAATVTITGGAGSDAFTGNAARDVMTGNGGNDRLVGAQGQDTYNIGVGRDVVGVFSNTNGANPGTSESTTALSDVVNGFTLSGALAAADNAALATANNAGVVANFTNAATAGLGANTSLLGIDLEDAQNNVVVAIEGPVVNAVGAAQGVTHTVTNGILTLGGNGASAVDTLGEWLTEAAARAATPGEVLAFVFGNSTYVFAENGDADILIELAGVTNAAGVSLTGINQAVVANSILVFDGAVIPT